MAQTRTVGSPSSYIAYQVARNGRRGSPLVEATVSGRPRAARYSSRTRRGYPTMARVGSCMGSLLSSLMGKNIRWGYIQQAHSMMSPLRISKQLFIVVVTASAVEVWLLPMPQAAYPRALGLLTHTPWEGIGKTENPRRRRTRSWGAFHCGGISCRLCFSLAGRVGG